MNVTKFYFLSNTLYVVLKFNNFQDPLS